MRIFDRHSELRDWAWLEEQYGPLVLQPASPGPGWRLAEIWEGVSNVLVQVQGQDGSGLQNIEVAWYWPNAPENALAGPKDGVPEGMIAGRCQGPARTDAEGEVWFPMGSGARYAPPERGPHAVWVYGSGTNSDVLWGLGLLASEDTLWPVFRWREDEEQPGPREQIREFLDVIHAAADAIETLLDEME